MKNKYVPHRKLESFMKKVMAKAGVRTDAALSVIDGLIETSLRGVDSHGVRLLPHYLRGVEGGRINPRPGYRFKKTSASTGTLDADHTFGHAAGMEAARRALELARKSGTGQIAVFNSSHFGAASCYALHIARNDMIGMSFTNTDALVKSYGGRRAFLGNNPICFTAPVEGEEPFCLDMATSIVTFNKIRQLREAGVRAPKGVGADKKGRDTTDPHAIDILLPIGGYKGYGLGMMVEILCSVLTGMPYGPDIPKMFEAPMSARRYLGHFVSAMRVDCFMDKKAFKKRLAKMLKELRREPAVKKSVPVQVPGDPEKKIFARRVKDGIPLGKKEYADFTELSKKYGVRLD